jgi:hypothetical protein
MFPDFKELLSELNAHQVRYLIVGGYAVSFHTEPRFTKDLDIVIGADRENSKAAYSALAKFGAPLADLQPADLIEPGGFYRMGNPPIMVDILPTIAGVEFAEAWPRRVDVTLDDTLTVPVISRQDLLSAKIAAGRPQDLADAAALREIPNEHTHEAPLPSTLNVPKSIDDLQRKGREKWLKRQSREKDHSPSDPGPTKTRSREHEPDLDNDPE